MNFDVKVFGWRCRFSTYKTPSERTMGVYDITPEGKHCLFLDYDHTNYEWLLGELLYLQRKYELSSLFIFQSSPFSYHVVCFDKFTMAELNMIVIDTNCDEAFKRALIWDFNSRVLRVFPKGITEKPYFKACLKMKGSREKSLAHMKFFKLNYEVPEKYLSLSDEYSDKNQKVYLIDYPTGKNI